MASGRFRRAAGIVMRRRGAPRSVYLVARRDELAFFGGYWAFPGGTVDAADEHVSVSGVQGLAAADSRNVAAADARQVAGADSRQVAGVESRDVVAAARELFEETGVLCVRDPGRVDAATRARLRSDLLAGTVPFAAALAREHLEIAGERFVPICRMTTPGFAPVRYETIFFLVDIDPEESPSIETGELVAGEFMTAGQALERWRAGEFLIVPPVVILLELLAAAPDEPTAGFLRAARDLTASYARGKLHQVYFTPGVRKLSLLTETLPPADHTNAYLVGTDTLYLIDPGATRVEEHAKLFEALEEATAGGARIAAVLLTHAHRDHIGAVPAVVEHYGIPVWAHAETARAVEGRFPVARHLGDGDRIPLGRAPDGRPGWELEVLYTPGHAKGHLAFRESRYGAILVGDMVSTLSTIVIAPPDGHLATYLTSLARLRSLPKATLYPSHGPAKRDSHAVIDQYVKHRAQREQKVLAALSTEPRTIDEILPQAYDDVTVEVQALARLSLEAGLIKLCEDGVAAERGDRYWRLRD